MSAFVVGKAHIDGLIVGGLKLVQPGSPLRWFWPQLGLEDEAAAYRRGDPWGPEAIRLYSERRRELTTETAGRVGAMLWAENRRSVDHRYDEEEIEPVYEAPNSRQLARVGAVDPLVILRALSCYEYQSCEHPEWESSEAHAFCDALRATAIRRLPGFDDAPGWELRSLDELRARAKAH